MNYILTFLFLTIANHGYSQLHDSLRLQFFQEIVSTLASDSMKGRAVGSIEEKTALTYITERVKSKTGRTLKYREFEFLTEDSTLMQSTNAYLFLNNHKKKTILLSAHYDHIGMGGKLSMSRKTDVVHNGADDNASGVAMVLGLLDDLSKDGASEVNYLFAFYSAHEVGLFGSEDFADFCLNKRKFKTISTVINFDMVGRLDPELKRLFFMCSDSLSIKLAKAAELTTQLDLREKDQEKLLQLDTRSFFLNEIDCLNLSTGSHIDYHAVSDDEQYINYDGMMDVFNFVRALIQNW
jgi:Zn-dependent M28 family amino/carboxypeptidase